MKALSRCTSLLIIGTWALSVLIPAVVGQSECGNDTLVATKDAEYFTSPNYTKNYSNNTVCQWRITAGVFTQVVKLRLLDFDLEAPLSSCTYNYVAVYDGNSSAYPMMQQLCGNFSSTQFVSTGPYMTIVFHSDGNNTFNGFKFEYTSQENTGMCTNITLSASETVKYLVSPAYPNNYPRNMTCQWVITSESPYQIVVLNLLDFHVRAESYCLNNYVSIYNGSGTSSPLILTMCRFSRPQFKSSGPSLTVVFHSGNGSNDKGFKMEYTSQDIPATCSDSSLVASASAKNLTSPGYPFRYNSSMDCQWFISTNSPSSVVLLKLLDFSLGGPSISSYCYNDYVSIYDGYGTSRPGISQLCGSVSTSTQFTNTGQYMTVVFHSNSADNFKGFVFEYSSQAVCTNSSFYAYAYVQSFTSPGYPNNYPRNQDCQWIITSDTYLRVVELRLANFSLESSPNCQSDYVSIYDGSGASSFRIQKLCGSKSYQQFTSNGRYMTVVFHSDQSVSSTGFKFEYTSKDKSVMCINASLTASTSAQYLLSPGYPYEYTSNLDCKWVITSPSFSQVVVLKLLNFILEGTPPSCVYDYVSIYDGMGSNSPIIQQLCGPVSYTEFTSTGYYMTVVLRTDGSTNLSGFRLEYSLREKLGLCMNNSLSASRSVNYITSPGYPYSYQGNTNCQWRITADSLSDVVELRVIDFNLESSPACLNDYVSIYDGFNSFSTRLGKLCGINSNTQYTSSGSYLFIVFYSDQSNSYKGFKLQYTSKTPAVCSGPYLTASTSTKNLTSPNYPRLYPSNTDCQWHISAGSSSNVVVLDLMQLRLAGYQPSCYSDYVKIYDGATTASKMVKVLCGSLFDGSYESTGSEMTVVFHSSGGTNYFNTGFRFTYQSQKQKDSSPDSTGAIVAIVICSIAVPFLVVVFIILIRKRMAYKQARAQNNGNRVARPATRENSLFVVGNATNSSRLHSSPDMDTLDSSSMFDPPPYSSLNFDSNDNLPSYTPRIPGYDISDLPPPYSPDLPASLNNSPRPRKSGAGVNFTQDGGGLINSGFSVTSSDEVARENMTRHVIPTDASSTGETHLVVSTVIPTAPCSSVA